MGLVIVIITRIFYEPDNLEAELLGNAGNIARIKLYANSMESFDCNSEQAIEYQQSIFEKLCQAQSAILVLRGKPENDDADSTRCFIQSILEYLSRHCAENLAVFCHPGKAQQIRNAIQCYPQLLGLKILAHPINAYLD